MLLLLLPTRAYCFSRCIATRTTTACIVHHFTLSSKHSTQAVLYGVYSRICALLQLQQAKPIAAGRVSVAALVCVDVATVLALPAAAVV
jgi:hypothetical protein